MIRHNYQDDNAQEFERVFPSFREITIGDITIHSARDFTFESLKTDHVNDESLGLYLDFRAENETVYIYRGLYSLGAELDSSSEEYASSGGSEEDKPKRKVPKHSGEMAIQQEVNLGDLPPQSSLGILGVAYGGSPAQQIGSGADVREKLPVAITFSCGPKEHKSSAHTEKKEVTLDQPVVASDTEQQQIQIASSSVSPAGGKTSSAKK